MRKGMILKKNIYKHKTNEQVMNTSKSTKPNIWTIQLVIFYKTIVDCPTLYGLTSDKR